MLAGNIARCRSLKEVDVDVIVDAVMCEWPMAEGAAVSAANEYFETGQVKELAVPKKLVKQMISAHGRKFNDQASSVLTAVVGHLCSELLDVGSQQAQAHSVTVRDISAGIALDGEMQQLFGKCKVLGGGAKELVPRLSGEMPDPTGPGDGAHGPQSLVGLCKPSWHQWDEICEFLDTTLVSGAKLGGEDPAALGENLERLDLEELREELQDLRSIKTILPSLDEGDALLLETRKYSPDAPVKRMEHGNGRETDEAWHAVEPVRRHRMLLRDSMQGITNPQIQALAAKAGVLAFNTCVPDEVRKEVRSYLNSVLSDAILISTEHHLHALDVVGALAIDRRKVLLGTGRMFEHCVGRGKTSGVVKIADDDGWEGSPQSGGGGMKFVNKRPVAGYSAKEAYKSALREVASAQQSQQHAIFPFLPFQRLVRELAHLTDFELHFDPAAFMVLRAASEAHLVQLFQDANRIAIRRGNVLDGLARADKVDEYDLSDIMEHPDSWVFSLPVVNVHDFSNSKRNQC